MFFLLFFLFNDLVAQNFSIQPKFASITAGGYPLKITVTPSKPSIKFKAGRQITIVNPNEVRCAAVFDPKNCKTYVVAVDTVTNQTDTCKISIVPWVSNLSSLKITEVTRGYKILGKYADTLFVNYNNILYKTGKDLTHMIPLSSFPMKSTDYYWAFLRTAWGTFIRNERDIYFSKNELTWKLDYTTQGRGIRNSFAYAYDTVKNVIHVFSHDYSVTGQDTFPHSVYRKTISKNEFNTAWKKVFTFYSKDQWAVNKTLFPACRHIHTLVVDPYTNHIWIGTGDMDQHSHIYYSADYGETWHHVGMGTQDWRVLSIWFTENYVYWSMDTSIPPQKIFRIPRSVYTSKGYWPDMSEKVTSGLPKNNVKYLVLLNREQRFIKTPGVKAEPGDIIWGNQWGIQKPPIDENNVLISLNDPTLDYRQEVAALPNSALWVNTTVIDNKGDKITILSANAEGQAIDNNPRIFGIKEQADGTADVQELLSTNAGTSVYSQLYPYEQDALGNIYFQTAMMNYDIYKRDDVIKTTLDWHDNLSDKGGYVADITNSPTIKKRRLKLAEYEGDVVRWQISKSDFNWQTLFSGEKTLTDTISVSQDDNSSLFVRALVKKESHRPVASEYVKIASKKEEQAIVTVPDTPTNGAFRIYPNPAKEIIYVQAKVDSLSLSTIELFDSTGVLIKQQRFDPNENPETAIYIGNLNRGLYILRIGNKKNTFEYKIVKT